MYQYLRKSTRDFENVCPTFFNTFKNCMSNEGLRSRRGEKKQKEKVGRTVTSFKHLHVYVYLLFLEKIRNFSKQKQWFLVFSTPSILNIHSCLMKQLRIVQLSTISDYSCCQTHKSSQMMTLHIQHRKTVNSEYFQVSLKYISQL